jgi:hypothetical protein
MKKILNWLFNTVTYITLALLILVSFGLNQLAGQVCYNSWNNLGNIGIQTTNPQRPLNIHGNTNCVEVTERFSYGDNPAYPNFLGHLVLLTPTTRFSNYTQCWDKGVGDMVLSSEKGQEAGGNIILSVHDSTKKIILAITCPPVPNQPSNRELERVKVLPIGRTEFNVGTWDWGLPKITLGATGANPSIRLYQSDGTEPTSEYGRSFPWYIQTEGHTMNFKWGNLAQIGSESVSTKVIYKMNPPDANIRVGINTTDPLGMLHGTG